MKRQAVWIAQAALVYALYGLFWLIPVDIGSALAGRLARILGPRVPLSNIARTNLRNAFPDMAPDQMEHIVAEVWENVGRVAAEFPHIKWLLRHRVSVDHLDYLHVLRDDGLPGLFISAHYGNWELAGAMACREGLPISLVYRAANNPYVERLYQRGRMASAQGGQIPKGQHGARLAVDTLRSGGHLGMLVDQKMNDGLAVPFFGRMAMTAPAVARFALKYRCPVIPARVRRVGGAHFHMTFYPPMDLPNTGDVHADTLTMMTEMNRMIEDWIREYPGQWLWLHRRWPQSPP